MHTFEYNMPFPAGSVIFCAIRCQPEGPAPPPNKSVVRRGDPPGGA